MSEMAMAESAGPGRNIGAGVRRRNARARYLRSHWDLYLMLLPGLVYFAVYKYLPMWGIVIAFQEYSVFSGIRGSEWVGLSHFREMFANDDFYKILTNT
jgi:putative aldouronate transport system permease protein